jgi:hypothetical protein
MKVLGTFLPVFILKFVFFKKTKKERENIEKYQLRFSLFVLGAQVLVTAFAAAGCADRIAGVAMHTYLYVE